MEKGKIINGITLVNFNNWKNNSTEIYSFVGNQLKAVSISEGGIMDSMTIK